MTDKKIEKIKKTDWEKEWDKLTDTSECPDELPAAEEWLRENKTLYSEGVFGEPMFDLDEDKIKQFIQKSIKEAVKEEREMICKEVEGMTLVRSSDSEANNIAVRNYNHALSDVISKIKEK